MSKKTACAICANAEHIGTIRKHVTLEQNNEKSLLSVSSINFRCGISSQPLNNIVVSLCSHFQHKKDESKELFSDSLYQEARAATEEITAQNLE